MEPGWYRLRARHSDNVLEIAGPSKDHGANLRQGTASDTTSQHWSLTASEGRFALRSRYSNKLVTVEGASTDDGAKILLRGIIQLPRSRQGVEVSPERLAPGAYGDGGGAGLGSSSSR